MTVKTAKKRLHALLNNSRFWILASGIVLSIVMAGFIQLFVPAGITQTIRIGEFYGLTSLLLLYIALLASPLTAVYPHIVFKEPYLSVQRAIGVLSFYYALLHVYINFFLQLGGFAGIKYYNGKYSLAVLLGVSALGLLFLATVASVDWVVDRLGIKNWKLFGRLAYLAGIIILIHIIVIGPAYAGLGLLSTLTAVAVLFILWLEAIRLYRHIKGSS